MADVLRIEEPTTTRTYTVWLAKGEGDVWGDATDSVYNRRFTPNRACVLVTDNGHEVFSRWMQVRRHYHGDPSKPWEEMCAEVATLEGHWLDYDRWAMDVRDQAVQAVKDMP